MTAMRSDSGASGGVLMQPECDVEMLAAADVDDAEAGYAAAGVYA